MSPTQRCRISAVPGASDPCSLAGVGLAGRSLAGAISDGTANLNWSQETFAYAQAHNNDPWIGVTTGAHIDPAPSGLLTQPNHAPRHTRPLQQWRPRQESNLRRTV